VLIRDIDSADLEAVCDLVDADHLPGQPPCRVDKVQNALAGRAEIDVLYWQKLRELPSLVATSGTGELHGAGSPNDPMFAFWFSTPMDLGLEGLPRKRRPRTHAALLRHGFNGKDPWLYMRTDMPTKAAQLPYEVQEVWWLQVDEEHRVEGMGGRRCGQVGR
jgi:hypothetical protein